MATTQRVQPGSRANRQHGTIETKTIEIKCTERVGVFIEARICELSRFVPKKYVTWKMHGGFLYLNCTDAANEHSN